MSKMQELSETYPESRADIKVLQEKAKAYDEALEKAKIFKEHLIEIEEKDYADEMDYIFPELAESEDERIRKELVEFIKSRGGFKGEWVVWLEKQGEQKEVEPTPIFRIGDILKRKGKDYTFRVDRIQGGYYHCDRNHGAVFPIEEQNNWELVEQKSTEWSKEDESHFKSIESTIEYCKKEVAENDEARYLHNEDLNWLKSLKDIAFPIPQQEWSDEDRKLIDDTCHLINTLASGYGTTNVTEPITFVGSQMIANIKSKLRALVDCRPQKNNWERVTKEIYFKEPILVRRKDKSDSWEGYRVCNDYTLNPQTDECYIRVEDINNQKQWKPSEGQMVALNCAITAASDNLVCLNVKDLESLYEQLKKLMEE